MTDKQETVDKQEIIEKFIKSLLENPERIDQLIKTIERELDDPQQATLSQK